MKKVVFTTKHWLGDFLNHERWLVILPALFFLLLAIELLIVLKSFRLI